MEIITAAWCKMCHRLYFVHPGELDTGRCVNHRCNRDCERCPFPDCIVEDENEDEIVAARQRDSVARAERRRAARI